MIRMNHPNLGFQIRASGPPRWDVAVAVGSPTAPDAQNLAFSTVWALGGALLFLLRDLSEVPHKGQNV